MGNDKTQDNAEQATGTDKKPVEPYITLYLSDASNPDITDGAFRLYVQLMFMWRRSAYRHDDKYRDPEGKPYVPYSINAETHRLNHDHKTIAAWLRELEDSGRIRVVRRRRTRQPALIYLPRMEPQDPRRPSGENDMGKNSPSGEDNIGKISPSGEDDIGKNSPSGEDDIGKNSPSGEDDIGKNSPLSNNIARTNGMDEYSHTNARVRGNTGDFQHLASELIVLWHQSGGDWGSADDPEAVSDVAQWLSAHQLPPDQLRAQALNSIRYVSSWSRGNGARRLDVALGSKMGKYADCGSKMDSRSQKPKRAPSYDTDKYKKKARGPLQYESKNTEATAPDAKKDAPAPEGGDI